VTADRLRASVVGGSGYVGGELARLLLFHPAVDLVQVTSTRLTGRPIARAHPNLRGCTHLNFSSPDQVTPVDVLVSGSASRHGNAGDRTDFIPLLPC